MNAFFHLSNEGFANVNDLGFLHSVSGAEM